MYKLNKNQIDYYNRIELNKDLKLLANEFNVSFKYVKSQYKIADAIDKKLIDDTIKSLKTLKTFEIKYLIFQDQVVLA